jgi:hypothetical protein
MVVATTRCARHGHAEFLLEADEARVPDIYLRNIADTIERMVAGGSAFKSGQTFQVGWMLTLVRPHADGTHLTLAEPDMQVMPIRWVGGVTHTLRQMMLQLFMLDSVGLRHEIDLPTVQHSLIACTHYADTDFFMERGRAGDAADTGWFLGCTRDDHDHNDPASLHRLSLYEALLRQRGIQGLAAFPIGSQIVVRRTGVEFAQNGKPLKIVKDSFLDTWMKNEGRALPPDAPN